MPAVRFPLPLQPGDRIGVTSPSSGVDLRLQGRLEEGLATLRRRGYDVVVGECMSADAAVSAPKVERAAELGAMLCDPSIRAVIPPWGGELAIDLLDQLDWAALAAAEPTWLVGFSDLTTVMVPITLRLGWATLHGANLMDTPYSPPEGLAHWLDVASSTVPVTQRSPGRHRSSGWDDYEGDPGISTMTLDATGGWRVVGGGDLAVSGRLIGGCIETLSMLTGTPYGDDPGFGHAHAEEGLVVYVEAAESDAFTIGRMLHSMRLAGWFDHARVVLVGRTGAPDSAHFTQEEAVLDALVRSAYPSSSTSSAATSSRSCPS